MAEQLKAELGDRLRLAGEAVASPARLRASLQVRAGAVPVGGGGMYQPKLNQTKVVIHSNTKGGRAGCA